MDVKKFSLAHGAIAESSSFDILRKSVRYISDSDRLTFVVVTDENEVWAIYPKAARFVFSLSDVSEVSAMCFLPSGNSEENCVALAVFDRKSGDSCLRIIDLTTMSDCYDRVSAFPGRATALTPIEPMFSSGNWALAFGLENGTIGIFSCSETSCDVTMIDAMDNDLSRSPVTKMAWLKTRHLLICGHESGFLSVCRLPSKQFVFGHQVDALPISCIVSTEPENDPRLTCFLWISAANGRRSSAAIIFRIEGENDNVICMGVHDLALNIPDTDTENAWAYLVDISSSKQLSSTSSECSSTSSNLVSFLWEIGVTGKSTDYYFALFDINAWFSWQSQANLHLKEPVFGGSKFLAVFRLPKTVNGDNRLLGAFAISSSITSFRPRVSVVPLTSPLLYPCSLSFDILCICADTISRVRFQSLQETLLRNCCANVDFSRISDAQLSAFVEKLTTLGLIDMFDGSSIGCSHYESVLNAFFKFAHGSEAVRFAKKIMLNEDYVATFRNWLFYRASAVRKDLDMSLDLIFQKAEAVDHLRAVESDVRLIIRLTSCLPATSSSFAKDMTRAMTIFLNLISAVLILLKQEFRAICLDAFTAIPSSDSSIKPNGDNGSMFHRRLGLKFGDVCTSREKFVALLTSNLLANKECDNVFLLLYTIFRAVPTNADPDVIESLLYQLDLDFSRLADLPQNFVRTVAAACFLDRRFPGHALRRCLLFSRPIALSPEDQLRLLRHLLEVDVDAAYEVSLQLLMIYKCEKSPIIWTSGVYFELFKVFVDIFVGKHYFDAPLRLCLLMQPENCRATGLSYLFKLACATSQPHFGNFLRLLAAFSASSGIDILRECIKYMCTSKERLLLERACIFFAERGSPYLAEALAIAGKANDTRFAAKFGTSFHSNSSAETAEIERLINHRRRVIEDNLAKLPDFVRQQIINKSRTEEVSWMFTAASPVVPAAVVGQEDVSQPTFSRPSTGEQQQQPYAFEWEDVEKLLKLSPNNPFVHSISMAKLTSTSSFTARRSAVMGLGGSQSQSSQGRLSTAKKCRFVDSPEQSDELAPPPAKAAFFVGDDDDIRAKMTKIGEDKWPQRNSVVPENIPVTPVVKTTIPDLVSARSELQKPIATITTTVTLTPDRLDSRAVIESDDEQRASTNQVPKVSAVTPVQKRFAVSSVKEPSPAQKAAKKIVKRSVRFSCSPKVSSEFVDDDEPEYNEPPVRQSVAQAPPVVPTKQSAVEECVVEISSDEDDYDDEEEEEEYGDQDQVDEPEPEKEEEEDAEYADNDDLFMEETEEDERENEEGDDDNDEHRQEGDYMQDDEGDEQGRESMDEDVYLSPVATFPVVEETSSQIVVSQVGANDQREQAPTPVGHIQPPPETDYVTLNSYIEMRVAEQSQPDFAEKLPPIFGASTTVLQTSHVVVAEQTLATAVVTEREETHSARRAATATAGSSSMTATRLIKSVSNISPNRLAAQMALRRSMRIATTKRKQEINEEKSQVSSSLAENAEPPHSQSPAIVEAKSTPPTEDVVVDRASGVVTPPLEQVLPSVVVEPETVLPEPVDVMARPNSVASEVKEPQILDLPPVPSRLTRSRSAGASTPTFEKSSLDTSMSQRTTRRARQTELEKLSMSMTSNDVDSGVSTRATRSRHTSGSSEIAASETPSEAGSRSNKRKRTQSASETPQSVVVELVVSPRRHLRKLSSASAADSVASISTTTTTTTNVSLAKAATTVAVPPLTNNVEAQLPPKGRKRAQTTSVDEAMAGMITPSSSPKKRARNAPSVSASAGKIAPSAQADDDDVCQRSAPVSPSRRTRRTAASSSDQATQLAAALSSIADSPAFHTRHSRQGAASCASSIHGGGDDGAASADDSPTGSTISAASSRRSRTTRASTRAVNR